MSEIFLEIVNRSIAASWMILAVLALRPLMKKAPKWITVLLWAVVAVRLICPFSIESVMSLIPSAETVAPDIMYQDTPQINSGIPAINATVNPYIGEHFGPTPYYSANPLQILIPSLAYGWLLGVLGMLSYALVSWWLLKRKLKTAVLLRDNIYQSENVASPFVLGIVKPKIYLPFHMNEQDMGHVIAHEAAHIARKDHLWKPFGFFLLSVCWFNPLFWVAYIVLCRDIELACDEKVIGELDTEQKADYSQALLTCSVKRPLISACPLAFGEVSVKERVKTVLKYKKPAVWIVAVAAVVCLLFAGCFLTDPIDANHGITDPNEMTAWQVKLMEEYPEYFGLDASNGLDVYVYQMTAGDPYFILTTPVFSEWEAAELMTLPGADLQEMQNILATYSVDDEKINIILWQNPLSSYIGDLWIMEDGETKEDLEARRAKYVEDIRYRLLQEPYEIHPGSLYDHMIVDIDGDGREEECYLTHGFTSGLSSFCFYMREPGTKKWEISGGFVTKEFYREMLFEQDEQGKVYINALWQGDSFRDIPPEWQRIDITFSVSSHGRTVEFFHNGESILYGQ